MTIGRNGSVIWCNSSGCRSSLTIPVALIDRPAENQRRWATGKDWTTDLAKGLDGCPRHPQPPSVAWCESWSKTAARNGRKRQHCVCL